jgi:hypothetical protein
VAGDRRHRLKPGEASAVRVLKTRTAKTPKITAR